jgi:organic hydroperoxide reductase OsmC/OhrA
MIASIDHAKVKEIVQPAHQHFQFSNAVRSNKDVELK